MGVPQVIDGRYQVKRLLGRGGQGSVYLAYDPNLDIDVAVKVLGGDLITQDFLDNIAAEAKTMAKLDHPHLVRIFEFKPSYPYIVMEYCDGGDLTHVIKSRPRMSLASVLELCTQLAHGLAAAHENDPSILHRDLKPGNVLFKKGVPKIADFGLAKALGSSSTRSINRGIVGTIRYMSPEQCFDKAKVDHRTDLWALGVILYELLSWRRPFDGPGDAFVQIAMKIRFEPPAPLPFPLPPPVAALLERALARDPQERFASARDMGVALQNALVAVADAERLSFPPDAFRSELDEAAARCAAMASAGQVDSARALTAQMMHMAPQDSLPRYWRSQLDPRITTRPSGALTGGESQDPDVGASVRTLIDRGSFREARRRIGELLHTNADDMDAREMLSALREKERRVKDALNEAYARADQARARGDLPLVIAVWQEFLEAFGEVKEGAAELAVAQRELELEREQAPDLAAAVAGAAPVAAAVPPGAAATPAAGPSAAAPLAGARRATLASAKEKLAAAAASAAAARLAARLVAAAAIRPAGRPAVLESVLRDAHAALESGAVPDALQERLDAAVAECEAEQVQRAKSVASRWAERSRTWTALEVQARGTDLVSDGAAMRAQGDRLAERAGDDDDDALADLLEALDAEIESVRSRLAWSTSEPALKAAEQQLAGPQAAPAGLREAAVHLRRVALHGELEQVGGAVEAVQKALAAAGRTRESKRRPRPLGRRLRAFNARYHPAALAAWDVAWRELQAEEAPPRRAAREAAVEAAHAALLVPPRGGPLLLFGVAGALLVAALAWWGLAPAPQAPATHSVSLLAGGGGVAEIERAEHDGRPFPALVGSFSRRVVELPPGDYTIAVKGGRQLTFEVPGVTSLVVFPELPDFQSALERAAAASEPAAVPGAP